jgi:two-component system sensor histidine kinase DesK
MKNGAEAKAAGAQPQGEGWLRYTWLVCVAWLPAMAYPLADLFNTHPAPPRAIVLLCGVALFTGIYVWAARRASLYYAAASRLGGDHTALFWRPVALLCVMSTLMTLGDGSRWLALFIYTIAVACFSLPARRAVPAFAALLLLAGICALLTHDAPGAIASGAFTMAVTGVTTLVFVQMISLVRQLRAAREEIARLAVAEERLRFARDLHDLLGHSLSLIALKSELAGRLALKAPERAAAEMRDVETVARDALQEVRAAVAGYRQPTLASELRSAAQILDAAGIAFELEGAIDDPPPALEGVLSWTVREGVTNVIRHSRARRCTIRLLQDGGELGIEVCDDGRGAAPATSASQGASGNGLAGLAERVAACGGQFAVGPTAGGGFRLAVRVPLERAAQVATVAEAG